MENAETCAAIKCRLVEKSTVVETGEDNLLVDLEDCIATLGRVGQIVTG